MMMMVMMMSSSSMKNRRYPNISQFKFSNILYPDQANIDAVLGDLSMHGLLP